MKIWQCALAQNHQKIIFIKHCLHQFSVEKMIMSWGFRSPMKVHGQQSGQFFNLEDFKI